MPRMVPGTAPPRLEPKSSISLPLNFLRTIKKAITMPVRAATGVARALRKVVSRMASTPRVRASFHQRRVGEKSTPQAVLKEL